MKVHWNSENNLFVIDGPTAAKIKLIYPFFEKELLKMEIWYAANPSRRKKNHYRFICNWLNRASRENEGIKPKSLSRDYAKENHEFNRKIEQARQEMAPPPSEWADLKKRLKRS